MTRQPDDEPIGEAVDRLAAEHDRSGGKRPLARKAPDFEAEWRRARAKVRAYGMQCQAAQLAETDVDLHNMGVEVTKKMHSVRFEFRRMYAAGRADEQSNSGALVTDLLALAERWETWLLEAGQVPAVEACARELRAVLERDDVYPRTYRLTREEGDRLDALLAEQDP